MSAASSIPLVDLRAQYLSIRGEIDSAMRRVVDETAFIGGTHVRAFEEEFARALGAREVIGVGNGTDAIAIVLKALGIGPGDAVATVANSFIASSEAITQAGALPVFVDCDPQTFCMDPGSLERALSARSGRAPIRAVVPVHLYGRAAPMDRILEIARRHGLRVVEDCAQAHLAKFQGRTVGTLGDAACFSFYPGKNLGAFGDAGAVATDDAELAGRVRKIANHGRVDKYDHSIEGVNSRLDALQAAILSVKLRYLPEWNAKRLANAKQYSEALSSVAQLILPEIPDGGEHVFHLYVVRAEDRDRLQGRLLEKGIATGVHYPIALPNLKAYRHLGHGPQDFPNASRLQSEVLSLPMYPELSSNQILRVVEAVKAAL